jgi:hypothetical protein
MPQAVEANYRCQLGAATSFAVRLLHTLRHSGSHIIVLSALAPKPDMSGLEGMQANQRSAVASREYVYGQVRKGGTITYMESTGVKNKYLHMVLVLAGHELSEIGDIYINDEVVTLDADGFATGDTWKSKVRIKKHLGDQTTADADLLAESEQIDSAFVGNGCAYLYIRLEYDSDVFANGIPLFTAIVKGAKVYDPRTATTAYSNNPALCLRHYLTASYGLGDTSSEIDDVAFAAAANVCDEDIALAAGGTQNQYEMNGVVSASMTFGDAISKMLSSCAGTLFWGGGKWQLKPGYYSTPTASFTLDDLRGTISGSPRANMRDSFNSVRGKFNDADQDWITVDYPEITSTVFVDEDNGFEQPLDLELPFTTSSPMAQRLAKITLYRARDAITFSADFGLSALSTQIGDTVALTIDRYGWSEKTFEVTGWKFYANQDAGDLRVNLVLREISASSFDWDADETEIVSNNTSLPTFNTVPAVTSLALEDGSFFGSDGTHYNGIRASWTASDDAFVERYQVQWKRSSQSEYQTLYTSETDAIISPLREEQLYNVRVRAINILDVKSDWVSDSFTTLEDQVAPDAPTSVTTTPGINNVVVNWVNPTDTDLDQVEIIRSEVNDINDASAESVAYVRGSYYVDVPPVVEQTYYYFVRAIDRTGNIGTPATVTTGGSRLIQSYDVDAGAIDLTSLSTEVINTLAEKVDIADYNITVDYQQQLDDAVTLLGTNALTLALNASSLESRINDAGITVDPSTGSVTIQGLSAIEDQVNQVVIDLDAVEGELSLKATTTYVNNAIAAATLPEATIAELDDLIARVDTAEIDINSIEGAITLTSTGLFYDVDDIDSRFTVTEGEIDVLQGQIVLKAEQTDLDNVEGRVTSAEVTINALDVPSITLAVQDVRGVANRLDDVSELTLAELLGRYADRQYLSQDIAYARQSLTADVNDQKVALSTAKLELGAQIDDNRALIVEEQTARASEDAVLAESVTTLSGSLFGDTGAITQINNVSLDSTSGIAQAVALLNTELELADGQFGVVESVSEVINDVDGIQAKYTVKVNVNNHVSGFGLISAANDGVPTSEFIVAADTFKIGAPVQGNVSDAAFAVYTEETVVGGITYPAGTYVNGFLNAENINVGTLNANRIQLDSAAFETDVDGNLIIVASGLPADQLKLGGEFKYNVTTKALEVNALSANSITSGTISTSLLDIDGTTLAIDGVTSALVVGTIDGAGNITPGSITAASIDAATITTDKLVLGSGTSLVDDGSGGLIVGTINGVDNITPGSITADSIAANTITTGLINLGDTSLVDDGSGGLVVGTFDGDDHINGGTISAGLLRLGNTTLGDDGSGQLVVGQIDGEGNITPGSITADRVDANFIDAFSINADNITTGSLSASRLRVNDFSNLAENADFELVGAAWAVDVDGWSVAANNTYLDATYSLRRTGTGTGVCRNDFEFAAREGDQFTVSAFVKRSSSYAGGNVQVGITWYQADGTFISNDFNGIAATTSFQQVTTTKTAPAFAAYGRGICRVVSQTAGTAYWGAFSILKKQDGAALIVNGTIEADQLKLGTASLTSDVDGALVLGDIQSDTYDAGVEGWRIDRDGSAEFNDVVISRNISLNSGEFDYPGTLTNGTTLYFVNSGIKVGRDEVWDLSKTTLIPVAVVASSVTAGGSDLYNTFWALECDMLYGARSYGWTGSNPEPADIWQQDPDSTVQLPGASASDQRIFFKMTFRSQGGAYAVEPRIKWRVYQVT